MIFEVLKTCTLLGWLGFLIATVVWVIIGMTVRRRDRPWWRWASEQRAWIILLVLASGLFFGTVGAYRSPASPIQGQYGLGQFVDALYEGALQLFLNGDVQANDSGFKRMARVAGLAAAALLAYEAIQRLFAKPIQQFWLSRQRQHIVICGLGRIGRSIISDFTNASPGPGNSDSANPSAAKTKKSEKPKLVVIERDKDNPDIAWAESRGVSVVIGDATDRAVLTQVRADLAKDVFFTIGSDELNLEGAYDLMRIVNQRAAQTAPRTPQMFIHLLNPRLESMLVQAKQRAFIPLDANRRRIAENLVALPFNVIDRSIQALIDGPVLERRPVGEDEIAHFVIVGFGEVGQELAIKLAQMAHYENLKRARMTIVYSTRDRDAVKHFRELYPKFFPNLDAFSSELNTIDKHANNYNPWIPFKELDEWSFGVSITFRNCTKIIDVEKSRGIEFAVNGGFDLSSGGVASDRFIANLEALSMAKGIRPMVFICNAEDELNCADATEIRNELDLRLKLAADGSPPAYLDSHEHRITIMPYVPNRPMLHQLIDPPSKPGADLIPWGDCCEICTHAALTADLFRPLATAINHDYELKYAEQEAKNKGTTLPTRASLPVKSLDALLAWQRHSNLMAAAHVNTKLAPLDLVLKSSIDEEALPQSVSRQINDIVERSMHHQVRRDWIAETEDDRLLELIAKMEHHRWIAERLLMDWGFGAKADKGKPENKKRLAFVDWTNLPDSEVVKDRDQIARILELCREEANRPNEKRRFVITQKPKNPTENDKP